MSEFKGTPGKWALGMDGEILSDAGYIVMGTDLVHGNENDLELIAAAPELLEALRGVMSMFPVIEDDASGRAGFTAEARVKLNAACSAIAKALGQ